MAKYDPLNAYLKLQQRDVVPMSFAEIESVLGSKLPPSKRNRAWWSNNPDNSVMTKAWLDAGFKTESVDITAEKLVFRRIREQRLPVEAGAHGRLEESPAAFSGTRRHPGFGFMKGLIKVADGFDVTKPFDDEEWDQGYLGGSERK
jgi:hypothetical protein